MSYQLGIAALDNLVIASPPLLSIENDCLGLKHSQRTRPSVASEPTSAFSWEGGVGDAWIRMKATELHKESRRCPCWVSRFSSELTYFSLFFPAFFFFFVLHKSDQEGKKKGGISHPSRSQYDVTLHVQPQSLPRVLARTVYLPVGPSS